MIAEVHLSREQTYVEHRAVVPFEGCPAHVPAGHPVAPRRPHRHGGWPAHSRELGEPPGSGHRPGLPSLRVRGDLRDHAEGDVGPSTVAQAPCTKAPGSARPGRYLFY